MSYLKSLINATNNSSERIAEEVKKIQEMKFYVKFSEDGTLRMTHRGELIRVNWNDQKDDLEFKLRAKMFYSAIFNANVERILADIRLSYGDIQNNWIDNKETVVDTAVGFIERLTMGDLSHLLPNMEDIDIDAPITNFNGHYCVDVIHFLKIVNGEVQWGEFRAEAFQWKLDEKTGLLHRDIIPTENSLSNT